MPGFGRESPMPQPDDDAQPPARVPEPHAWDPRTSYIPQYQVRLPEPFFERLQAWAKTSEISTHTLIIEILEEAARARPPHH
jgi:hypothetical protein